jgi:hypothetical protein
MRLLASDLDQQIQVCSCAWDRSCMRCAVYNTDHPASDGCYETGDNRSAGVLDVVSCPRRFRVVAKVP